MTLRATLRPIGVWLPVIAATLGGCKGDPDPDILKASLPGGGTVEYRAVLIYDKGFHETRKELIWSDPQGVTRAFLIDNTHSGYDHIEIRISKDANRLWLVDLDAGPDHFGGALDLRTGKFHPEMSGSEVREFGKPVDWAGKSGGIVLARKKFR